MDDDWGLHAVVRGCSAAFSPATSASSAATSAATTTTQTTSPFMADFQPFNIHHHSSNNNNSSFLFSSSSSSSSSSFGNIGQSGSSSSSGYSQLFSLSASSSSDLATMMRPSSRSSLSHGHVNAVEDLHDLYRPFFTKPESTNNISQLATTPNSSGSIVISSFSRSNNSSSDQRSVQQQQQMKHNSSNNNAKPLSHSGSASATTPRSKKRKNQLKKVCQVPAESLSSDIWAWRKYGQKPIKGSPYPRGYYRCSSSKGCLARKQVERNRSDPGMFIVTYTAEHNHPAPTHRNSLAGSTRQKPSLSSASASVSGEPANPSEPAKPSSPATSPEEDPAAAGQAQSGSATESKEGPESSTLLMDDDEDDDEFGFSDMAVSDDFFVGLEGLGAPETGEFFSDNFPAGLGLSWSVSSAATAAGGS